MVFGNYHDDRLSLCLSVVQLVLKHRQGKNHRMRIVAFIGSPIDDDEKEVCLVMPCFLFVFENVQ